MQERQARRESSKAIQWQRAIFGSHTQGSLAFEAS